MKKILNELEDKIKEFINKEGKTEYINDILEKIDRIRSIYSNSSYGLYGNINKFETSIKNYQEKNIFKTTCEGTINDLSKKIEKLNDKKIHEKLAVDIINKYLSYIFFDNNRLKIGIDSDI